MWRCRRLMTVWIYNFLLISSSQSQHQIIHPHTYRTPTYPFPYRNNFPLPYQAPYSWTKTNDHSSPSRNTNVFEQSDFYDKESDFLPQNEIQPDSTLESPLLYLRRGDEEDHADLYREVLSLLESPANVTSEPVENNEEAETEEPIVEDDDDLSTTTEIATTTEAPFTIKDVKVPASFLRIEYMISYAFLGTMYGLGFFVLFQSLCVPAAKIAVVIVYTLLLKYKAIEPITLEAALEQLPPI